MLGCCKPAVVSRSRSRDRERDESHETDKKPRPLPSEITNAVFDPAGSVRLQEAVEGHCHDGEHHCGDEGVVHEHYKLIQAHPESDFHIEESLGKGAFATVVRGIKKEPPRQHDHHAIKSIDLSSKADLDKQLGMIALEIMTLRRISEHPNICHIHDCYMHDDTFHMVLDLCTGGMLFDRILARQHYTEQDARFAFAQITEAVGHCHRHEVVHRDLKPENVLYVAPEGEPNGDVLKVCDFGLSAICHGHDLRRQVGTPGYDAPEIIGANREHRYGPEVDLWSLGCILYVMLSGFMPFYGSSMSQVHARTKAGEYDLGGPEWATVSPEAKDLIRRLLVVDPETRATCEDVFASPWLAGDARAHDVHLAHFCCNYRSYRLRRKFQAAVLAVMATRRLMKLAAHDSMQIEAVPAVRRVSIESLPESPRR